MEVDVLLFASYADALGKRSLSVTLPHGSRVRDALDYVRALPGAERLPPAPLVAVNAEYAALDHTLSAGDEVALIPPVAGG
jgi:molybdopterin converting factor small subunit